MKMLLRPVQENDLEAIYQLSLQSGFGLTTLSKSKIELEKRIKHSLSSFLKNANSPTEENYLFVLEDVESNTIVGTSAIEASAGYSLPFYAYRVSKVSNICHELDLRVNYKILTLNNDFQGMTELGTLYLEPKYRCNKNGLLLSRARFLFMALFPNRFSDNVIAEMRGVSDEEGNSPFWQSFGEHFFKMPFSKADELSVLTDKQFISDLLPQHPVHINLLSRDAQNAIGQPHSSTIPAMKILQKEGFYYNCYVDIFDAGPALQVKRLNISTIKNQQTLPVIGLNDTLDAEACFISNTDIHFRAISGQALIENNGVVLSTLDANLLGVRIGDCVQVIGTN